MTWNFFGAILRVCICSLFPLGERKCWISRSSARWLEAAEAVESVEAAGRAGSEAV